VKWGWLNFNLPSRDDLIDTFTNKQLPWDKRVNAYCEFREGKFRRLVLPPVDPSLLVEPAEIALWEAIKEVEESWQMRGI